MGVHIYTGCLNIVKKSGIGQAILHQKEILRTLGEGFQAEGYRDADIIHINTIFPDSPIIALMAKRQGKKVIYYGHSTMEDFRNSFIGSNRLAGLFKKWIKLCYSTGDIIITPTEYSKRLLESYDIKPKIYAVSNGIDTETFKYSDESGRRFRKKYGLADNEKIIISVGHFIERKGILEFVELAKAMPEKKFFWFGYTDKHVIPQNIRRAIEQAPANLQFPGYIDQEELRDAYCGCDVFAFTSFEETEGIVVLEALSCGTQSIVRDIPVYEDWLKHGETIYKAKDINEFQRLIEDICDHQIADLSDKGRQVAEARSIESMSNKLEMIYRDCLAEKAKVAGWVHLKRG